MKTTGGKISARPSERLVQSHWCIGLAGGQDLRCEEELLWGKTKLAFISSFQDYPFNPRTFI